MKDYAQYTSRIPSPSSNRNSKRYTQPVHYNSPNRRFTNVTTTRNVTSHPLQTSNTLSPQQQQQQLLLQDKRERESVSTVSSGQRQAPSQDSMTTSSSAGNGSPSAAAAAAAFTPTTRPTPVTPQTPASPNTSTSVSLHANDALSLRQHGPEATVGRLRQALDDATARDATAKAALAKSDAVILELRSSLRTVKRQLEALQADSKQQQQQQSKQQQQQSQQQKSQALGKAHQLQQQIVALQHQLSQSQNASSKDAAVGELQVQLDRAHAQILTADMVRKELEDTLEAEQYTWELRVQDQERQIAALQEECQRLSADLEDARSQWKEAEDGWSRQVEELQQQLTQTRTRLAATQAVSAASKEQEALQQKIRQLETERSELQNCLDEALQELEAVDKELQEGGSMNQNNTNNGMGGTPDQVIESMQHLLRWISLEGPPSSSSSSSFSSSNNNNNKNNSKRTAAAHNLSRDPRRLLDEIQTELEEWLRALNESKSNNGSRSRSLSGGNSSSNNNSNNNNTMELSNLQAQVQQYQDELKNREESSAELRQSLREAVALLKPLQDAVANAEGEKQALQHQLDQAQKSAQQERQQLQQQSQKMEALQAEIVQLEQQVQEQTSIAAARGSLLESSPTNAPRNVTTSSNSGGKTTDNSLIKIQRAREELRRKRETEGNLQQLLKDAQSHFHSLHQRNEDAAARNRELQGKLQQAETQMSSPSASAEDQLSLLQRQLRDREAQVAQLQQALDQNGQEKVKQLDKQLQDAMNDLAAKEQSEKILNKSLKDALGLLKPLQMHLEEAEREKMDISKELRNLRKRFRQLQMNDGTSTQGDDQSKSTFGGGDVSVELIKIKEELEEAVRQLEMENSQLHDALEDMSENGMAEAKLRQKLVELHSRYEVTQNKLEDVHVENHALVKSLKQKEAEARKQATEIERLRRLLNNSESELVNAKTIAKTALVKVEELTMSNIEQMSLSRDGSADMHFPVGAALGRF